MKIHVKLKPNAKQEKIVKISNSEYEVSVHAPPHEGKANEALIALLSKHFDIPKTKIQIVAGLHGRKKTIQIHFKI